MAKKCNRWVLLFVWHVLLWVLYGQLLLVLLFVVVVFPGRRI